MSICKICGKETELPFHTCNGSAEVKPPRLTRKRMKKRPAPPRSLIDKVAEVSALEMMEQRANEQAIQPGDIIQTVTQDHPFIARIGIVHHLEGSRVICYLPGRKGQPSQFRVEVVDVQVVGKARLRFNKELPEESVYADNALDKI